MAPRPSPETSPSNSIIVALRLQLLTSIAHPLQKKFIEIAMEEAGVAGEEAHDRKLLKSLEVCQKEGIHFVPLAWESTGGATETVHETVRKWT